MKNQRKQLSIILYLFKRKDFYNAISHLLLSTFIIFITYFNSYADPVDSDMVKKAANNFLSHQITIGLQKPALPSKISEIKIIEDDNKTKIAYIIELEPEGFLILSGDTDINPLLGYSYKGEFKFQEYHLNTLLHLVKWDIEARLKNIAIGGSEIEILIESNNELWQDYLSGNISFLKTADENDYIIQTKWHQGSHYNYFCPTDPDTGKKSDVGCVATATAQIVNHWQFPSNIYFSSDDSYPSNGKNGIIRIPEDSGYSFSDMNDALSIINYNGNETEEAWLCYAIGIKLEMSYSSDGSGAGTGSAIYKKLNFGSAIEGPWGKTKEKVILNIENYWPVQISVKKSKLTLGGHSLIVDGYNQTTDTFHVNLGWGGYDDTWYRFPDIAGDNANYHVIKKVVYDICPYQAWAQVGGGASNQNNVPYDFPNSKPQLKWALTVPKDIPDYSNYHFNNLIVGTGDKLYTSLESSWSDDNDPTYVCEINTYGYIENKYKIAGSDEPIAYLSQNSKGEGLLHDEQVLRSLW